MQNPLGCALYLSSGDPALLSSVVGGLWAPLNGHFQPAGVCLTCPGLQGSCSLPAGPLSQVMPAESSRQRWAIPGPALSWPAHHMGCPQAVTSPATGFMETLHTEPAQEVASPKAQGHQPPDHRLPAVVVHISSRSRKQSSSACK